MNQNHCNEKPAAVPSNTRRRTAANTCRSEKLVYAPGEDLRAHDEGERGAGARVRSAPSMGAVGVYDFGF